MQHHVTDATFFGNARLFTRLCSYEKFMKIPPLELLVDTEDPAWVVCVCVGGKKRTEKWKGIRIFAERCWCHDYTTLHWRHVSCLRPLFCLDMELPKHTRVLCIAFTYVSFFLAWLLYNEITHSQIKLNNTPVEFETLRIYDSGRQRHYEKALGLASSSSAWAAFIVELPIFFALDSSKRPKTMDACFPLVAFRVV